ncbi:MAG: hypothetical protein A3F12_00845 [Gammaproteobacteria bacterium RIFCSPHIGHO2_12_FULL_38_14]|nr:MAG: hypothetical protein A3F12_00845 [Gammaproteobacteria bacterium RIFCSPHIGHO2_12_FULL_38_14]
MLNLYRVNLNLLIALDVLLQERSVTRSAKKIFISQAAMSGNLQQLRKIFKDNLLVRQKKTMVLTQYAMELQPRLHRILEELRNVVEGGQSFNPKTHKKIFNIGMSDEWAAIVLPKLITILEAQAPYMQINIIPIGQIYTSEPFEKEIYEIGVARVLMRATTHIRQTIISGREHNGFCIVNSHHPLAKKKRITLSDYIAYPHIAWRTKNPEFQSEIDQTLQALGKPPRNTILHTPYFSTIFKVLEKSDNVIASITRSALSLLSPKHHFSIKLFPFRIPDAISCIAWHTQFDNDQAHTWLRNQIIDIARNSKEHG